MNRKTLEKSLGKKMWIRLFYGNEYEGYLAKTGDKRFIDIPELYLPKDWYFMVDDFGHLTSYLFRVSHIQNYRILAEKLVADENVETTNDATQKCKLFISCPMADRNETDILYRFEKMQKIAEEKIGRPVEVINPYKPRECKTNADTIRCLAESIAKMADAEYFIGPSNNALYRGCYVENIVARKYGLLCIYGGDM